MQTASIIVDVDFVIGNINPRLFGSFVEHLGRAVYGGIFEPSHATADEQGFRKDVLELVKELGVTIVRYPGGNFVSGYNWEDGVGPPEQRPARLDLAWFSTETNQFGTNEFVKWCEAASLEPMFAVNLGTRGAAEAQALLEYCNHQSGTKQSDLRISHGYEKPHEIKFWCLGNEMDGPWQIGAKTAHEYGRLAKETAKLMRWVDPSVELAACGSSHRDMTTFGAWEYEVLEQCFDEVDYISLHTYFTNPKSDTSHFLAALEPFEAFIKEVIAIADAVAAKRRSSKKILLSLDEWNVWYRARKGQHAHPVGWPQAPKLLEEVYDMQDALLVGGALISLLNHCDRVTAGCLAQLVNVIGPIMTETGGAAWRQTIFHPFALTARIARGKSLQHKLCCNAAEVIGVGDVPDIKVAVTLDELSKQISLFILHRNLKEEVNVSIDIRGVTDLLHLISASSIHDQDLSATNNKNHPNRIKPQIFNDVLVSQSRVELRLKPASWTVVTLGLKGH
jgi:alpha-L-arabinofuranosidase